MGQPSMARPRGESYSWWELDSPFPSWSRRGRKGERERRKGGPAPTQLDWAWGGALHLASSSSLPLRPNKAHTLTGAFQ